MMVLRWLNYHHLQYFWAVARHGGLKGAASELGVGVSTVSTQIKQLETMLGVELFDRNIKGGRKLQLTDVGQLTYRYADDIFALGSELVQRIDSGSDSSSQRRLSVGICEAVPAELAQRLIDPALATVDGEPMRLLVRHGDGETLLELLASREIDLVLSDLAYTRIGMSEQIPCYSTPLGVSSISFLASPQLIARSDRKFPACFESMPMYLPARGTQVRRRVDLFLQQNGLEPTVLGEFSDAASLAAFARKGHAAMPALSLIAGDLADQLGLKVLGQTSWKGECLYAVTAKAEITHPGISAIVDQARALA